MSAPAPSANTGAPMTLSLSADGAAIDSDRIVSVETWAQANRIPRARIVLYDGEPETGDFPFSDAATFVPGAKIVVSAGYGSDAAVLHTGVVVRHGLRIVPGAGAQLVIETADPLLKMTRARHSAVTKDATDAKLIAALVSANGGSIGTNDAGTDPSEAMVQAHASDWDLLLLRAEASGCVAFVAGSKVDIVAPTGSGSAVLQIDYGDSVVAFDAAVDATAMLGAGAVDSHAWDYATQKVVAGAAGSVGVGVPGNLKPAAMADVLGVDPYVQQTAALRSASALQAWSSATLMRARLSQLVGTVKVQGSALAKPGCLVTLGRLGDRFDGDAWVGGVRHHIAGNAWHTTLELGLAAERFASRQSVADAGAAGLTAPIRGLQTGQVVKVAEDPTGDFRVLVTLPLIDADNGIWARLAQPYASKGFGWSMFPEVGDEVVLGFMNEDPASAVVIASVYSGGRAPTHAPNADNDVKSLVTRSKMEVKFDDKDVICTISTPGGHSIVLDDKATTVTILDSSGNTLKMAPDLVTLSSAAAMTIKSATNMTIDCGAKLSVSATAKAEVAAPMIGVTADTQLALASNAMASLKAAAMLEVNGALVKIN